MKKDVVLLLPVTCKIQKLEAIQTELITQPAKTISAAECARLLGSVEIDYVYRLLRVGRIKAQNVGRVWYVDAADAERFKAERDGRRKAIAARRADGQAQAEERVRNARLREERDQEWKDLLARVRR